MNKDNRIILKVCNTIASKPKYTYKCDSCEKRFRNGVKIKIGTIDLRETLIFHKHYRCCKFCYSIFDLAFKNPEGAFRPVYVYRIDYDRYKAIKTFFEER